MTSGRSGAVIALAGALTLAAVTAPTAHAADTHTGISVSNVVINKGKPVVVGTTNEQVVPMSFRYSLPAGWSTAHPGLYEVTPYLYNGTSAAKGAQYNGPYPTDGLCHAVTDRIADCTAVMRFWPDQMRSNSDATTWKIGAVTRLYVPNRPMKAEEFKALAGGVQIRRWAKATVNASPEPVKKGKTLTVTGTLTRADWVKHKYTGVAEASVQLQFRKKGAAAYSTVKTVKSSSTGSLKTTVTASADGYWRWNFGGWHTTGAAVSPVDYVDVN